MRFVHPQILFFLFALAIPVAVHLLKLHRYRREYFSNVRLLEQIRQERKRSSRLRELLVLVARMLTLACLVFAFSQPFIPTYSGQDAVGSRLRVGIYLDNSFSMQAPTRESVLLEEAKAQVEKILEALPADASVQFATNRFSGKEQSFRSVEAVRKELGEIECSPVSRSFLSVVDFQRKTFDALSIPSSSRVFYYVSDFQKSVFSLPTGRWADNQSRYVFVPVSGTDYSNLSLDSLSLDVPLLQAGRETGLRIEISNHSEHEQLQVPLRLFVQEKQVGVYPLDFEPGETRSVRIPFQIEKSGDYSAYAEIADYPIEFDNRLYFSLSLGDKPQVLHLYQDRPSSSLERLFGRDSVFGYAARSLSSLDYAQIPASRLVVADAVGSIPSALESALALFVREGGSLVVFPPPASDLQGGDGFPSVAPEKIGDEPPLASLTQDLLGSSYGPIRKEKRRIRQVDFSHPVFSLALDGEAGENLLPEVSAFYPMPASEKAPYRSLMSFSPRGIRPQEDFLRVYSVGKGLLYLFSTSLQMDNTDFASHYTFVVSLLNMALFQGEGPRLYYDLGAEQGMFFPSVSVPAPGRGERYFLLDPRSGKSLMPLVRQIGSETAFFTYGQIGTAGNYLLGIAPEGFFLPSFDSLRSEDRFGAIRERGWKTLHPVSFNFDRAESAPACYTVEELRKWVRGQDGSRCFLMNPGKTDLSQSVRQLGHGKELWKVFVIFALLFVLLETLFLRGSTRPGLSSGIPKKKE